MTDTARITRLIYQATRICKHARPTDVDLEYWGRVFARCEQADGEAGIQYAYRRCLGENAGEQDIPPFGPYGRDRTTPPPPPYPEEGGVTPPPDPQPDPQPTPCDLTAVLERLDRLILATDAQREAIIIAIGELKQSVKDGIKVRLT